MSSTGYTLMGWQVDPATGEIKKDMVSALQVMSPGNQTSAPEATEKAYVSGVIDKNDTNITSDKGYTTTLQLFDDLGYSYTAKFSIKKEDGADEGIYSIKLTDIIDSESNSILLDEDGFVTKAFYESLDPAFLDSLTLGRNFPTDQAGLEAATTAIMNAIFDSDTLVYDENEGYFIGVGADQNATNTTANLLLSNILTGDTSGNGNISNFKDIVIDFSKTMNYNNNGTSTAKMLKGDIIGDGTGKKLGALTGLTVDTDGKVYGSYDNGNTVLLCQISVAQFANASGLEKVGNNCYQTTLNSGEFDGIGIEITADGSKISTGELEMSNVDLSAQFTDMIITQSGFQAKCRGITT